MKKWLITLLALGLTAGLGLLLPGVLTKEEAAAPVLRITRVWILEQEPAVTSWLKKRAAAYEKDGGRIYLRAAAAEETAAALSGAQDGPLPDLIILPDGNEIVALRGYALILRDDSAAALTPAPTSALFFRPSPTPGPSPTPAPTPNPGALPAILAPEALQSALPGIVVSVHPARDLAKGKAPAALLTAGQASELPFGYQSWAVPEGKGILPVGGQALSAAGEAFLRFLLSPASQQALRDHGLYSPTLKLYSVDDPLRHLIESSIPDFSE